MDREISRERKQAIKEYYLQDDIVEEMVRVANNREFAPTYPYGYGKRPDAVNMPGDFRNFVERGAIAFHGSVEHWKNPHLIDTVSDPDDLRTGWDLIMDIDCDEDMLYAKITARELVDELEAFGIDNISVKFSGNRGFHVAVRGEAFPDRVEGKPISNWYPKLPRTIVDYLRDRLRDRLRELFLEQDASLREMMEDENSEDLNPYMVCDIENNWGDRHLFRMPYSVNEKSWLVSLPIATDEIMGFVKEEDAVMEEVSVEKTFLKEYEDGEGTKLVVEALDWWAQHRDEEEEESSYSGEFDIPDDAIPEEHFPPTIHNILEGLEDGRKRALFILITFLAHCGYDWDSIRGTIHEWNERNDEPLGDTYIQTQINWHQRQDEPLLPPNFDSNGYYQDMQVYEEDPLTENVNNPVSYAFAKHNDEEDAEDADGGNRGDGSDKSKSSEKEIVECPYCGKEYKGETKWYRDHVMECDG